MQRIRISYALTFLLASPLTATATRYHSGGIIVDDEPGSLEVLIDAYRPYGTTMPFYESILEFPGGTARVQVSLGRGPDYDGGEYFQASISYNHDGLVATATYTADPGDPRNARPTPDNSFVSPVPLYLGGGPDWFAVAWAKPVPTVTPVPDARNSVLAMVGSTALGLALTGRRQSRQERV